MPQQTTERDAGKVEGPTRPDPGSRGEQKRQAHKKAAYDADTAERALAKMTLRCAVRWNAELDQRMAWRDNQEQRSSQESRRGRARHRRAA